MSRLAYYRYTVLRLFIRNIKINFSNNYKLNSLFNFAVIKPKATVENERDYKPLSKGSANRNKLLLLS